MSSYHPTDIRLREDFCGHAITLKNQGVDIDKSIFQVGVAAHAVLEDIGKYTNVHDIPDLETVKEIANKTMTALCTEGRSYDGNPEPPMTLTQCQEGKEIAIKHWIFNPLPKDAIYEMPIAFDKDWNEVDYNSNEAVFRTLLDMVMIEEEVDEEGDVSNTVIVRDFKTSWHITNEMLDNIQRRAQVVVAHLKYPQADTIKAQVFGLRNGKLIERIIYTNAEHDMLEQWKQDITLAVDILQKPQTASPGANCMGCPYAHACEYISQNAKHHQSLIERYVASLSIAKSLEPEIKKLTKDANHSTNGGYVGYTKKTRKTTDKQALHILWSTWQEQNGDIEGFIQMLSPTATAVKKIIKHLNKSGADCSEMEEVLVKDSAYSSFGVHKT